MKSYTHCSNNLAVDAVIENDCILLSLYISRKGHVAYNRKCGTKFQARVPYSGKKINFLTATNK